MGVIQSIFAHMWLLLTLRHDGRGLPVTNPVALAVLFLVFLLGAIVRHHDAMDIPSIVIGGAAMMLVIVRFISVRFAAGYMLISIAIDTLHTISGLYGDAPFWKLYECACSLALLIRADRVKEEGSS